MQARTHTFAHAHTHTHKHARAHTQALKNSLRHTKGGQFMQRVLSCAAKDSVAGKRVAIKKIKDAVEDDSDGKRLLRCVRGR